MTVRQNDSQAIYLVRHGQTALNAEGRLRGLANPPLDEVGIREAHNLADALVGSLPVRVLSSPLGRTVHSAQIIADKAGVTNTPDARFTDRDYGPWTGEIKDDVIARFGSVDAAPGVEPVDQVMARVKPALDAVADDLQFELGAAAGELIIVTHDAVIRPLITAIDPGLTDLVMATGCWNLLVREGGRWRVDAVNQKPTA